MSAVIRIIDAITRPRHENGVDFGRVRHVLAKHGDREVWWTPGGKYWSGIGMQSYAPASLELVDMSTPYPYNRKRLHEGRLSFKVLEEHRDDIDRWLQLGAGLGATLTAAGRINPRRTYTVEVF